MQIGDVNELAMLHACNYNASWAHVFFLLETRRRVPTHQLTIGSESLGVSSHKRIAQGQQLLG